MNHFFKFLLFVSFITSSCASNIISPHTLRSISSASEIEITPISSQNGIDVFSVDRNSWFIVRVDLEKNSLLLYNPPETRNFRMQDFAKQEKLSLLINAAMYAKDHTTSIGYMKNYEKINNPNFRTNMSGLILFNPKNINIPKIKIGEKADLPNYNSAFQTYRMWSPAEGILWKKGIHYYYQTGLIGVDQENILYFFFYPGRIDIYEYVEKVIRLLPHLAGLLYLDGDSHGALYLDSSLGKSWNARIRSLPNLLGVKAIK